MPLTWQDLQVVVPQWLYRRLPPDVLAGADALLVQGRYESLLIVCHQNDLMQTGSLQAHAEAWQHHGDNGR